MIACGRLPAAACRSEFSAEPHWTQWDSYLRAAFGVEFWMDEEKVKAMTHPLNVLTGCSGTEAPMRALEMLIPESSFVQSFTFEHDENAMFFLSQHFAPEHRYMKFEALIEPASQHRCINHPAEDCTENVQGEMDLAILGIPCKPFSPLNLENFRRAPEDKFQDYEAKPFFVLSKWLQEPHSPKCVVIENVSGMAKGARHPETFSDGGYDSALDFLLTGKVTKEDGTEILYGLEHNTKYMWRVLTSAADDFFLPHQRSRVFVVGIRLDIHGVDATEMIHNTIKRKLESVSVTRDGHIDHVLLSDRHALDAIKHGRGPAGGKQYMSDKSIEYYDRYRLTNGLPGRSASGGQPISEQVHPDIARAMGARKLEIADVIALIDIKVHGRVRPSLVADLSQSLNRRPDLKGFDLGLP